MSDFQIYDRVKETTTTTGTGTLTLAGAVTGYQSFAAVGLSTKCYYCVEAINSSGIPTGDWEVGFGTYTPSGTTLSRTTVLASSNSGSLVSFSAGTKNVFCVAPASLLNGLVLIPDSGVVSGLAISNNVSDATNDIDIAVGVAGDVGYAAYLRLSVGITKRLDASWAVGSNQGGLDFGSIANTTYHVWLIRRSDTGVVDALFSTSASSPTMPANYDQKCRIGSIVRAGATILAFTQTGDWFMLSTPVLDISANAPGTSAATRTMSSIPTGVKMMGLFNFRATNSTTVYRAYLSPLDTTDLAPSTTAAPLATVNSNAAFTATNEVFVMTNTSAQIRSRVDASAADVTLNIATLGWIDVLRKG